MNQVENYVSHWKAELKNNFSLLLCTGVNLTTDANEGQLDAYVQSAEWDLEGFLLEFFFSNELMIYQWFNWKPFEQHLVSFDKRSFTNVVQQFTRSFFFR